jgi:hypothetical protein
MPYINLKSNNRIQMRKIESQMIAAVQGNRNWTSGNTCVTFDPETGASKVFLHGNLIATVTEDTLELFDGGWQSNTTKSRLNALCSAFAYAGEGVFQKDWTWYVRRWVGNLGAQSCWKTEEFVSGYLLA